MRLRVLQPRITHHWLLKVSAYMFWDAASSSFRQRKEYPNFYGHFYPLRDYTILTILCQEVSTENNKLGKYPDGDYLWNAKLTLPGLGQIMKQICFHCICACQQCPTLFSSPETYWYSLTTSICLHSLHCKIELLYPNCQLGAAPG